MALVLLLRSVEICIRLHSVGTRGLHTGRKISDGKYLQTVALKSGFLIIFFPQSGDKATSYLQFTVQVHPRQDGIAELYVWNVPSKTA